MGRASGPLLWKLMNGPRHRITRSSPVIERGPGVHADLLFRCFELAAGRGAVGLAGFGEALALARVLALAGVCCGLAGALSLAGIGAHAMASSETGFTGHRHRRGEEHGSCGGSDGQTGHRGFRVDRKSGVEGKSVSVRVDLGGRRSMKKK